MESILLGKYMMNGVERQRTYDGVKEDIGSGNLYKILEYQDDLDPTTFKSYHKLFGCVVQILSSYRTGNKNRGVYVEVVQDPEKRNPIGRKRFLSSSFPKRYLIPVR